MEGQPSAAIRYSLLAIRYSPLPPRSPPPVGRDVSLVEMDALQVAPALARSNRHLDLRQPAARPRRDASLSVQRLRRFPGDRRLRPLADAEAARRIRGVADQPEPADDGARTRH